MKTPGRATRALLLLLTLSLLACSGFGCGDSDRGEDAGGTQDAGDASDAGSDDGGECAELGDSCATAPCCSGLRCVGVALPGMTSMECEAE